MPDHKKDKTGERTHQRYGWQHIVERVLKGYDFDEPPCLEALRSRAGLAFRVDAVTAGQAKRYLLRAINHNFYSAAEIRSELHWLTALDCETDLTVQTPIPREDGEFLTSSSQQWNWTLFQWLPGTHIDPQTIREDQCERLGELLAKIHLHSEEFSPASWFVRPELDCRRLIGDGEFSPPPDGGAVFSQDEFRLINQLADNARDRWAEVSKSAGARRLIHS
ncbi:MAG: phosphotransferase, partial [bacterium]|nr:phosphotransferase [bacterium]